ncbi:calmodulin-lysine N-methyltransferase [Anopheles aquasalis]|uniref:calmodulin-lysine N-methyltransferase n=1 Tax=Anopheles aquasalis TaxID=42839 RepID=UPI00215A4BC0|nr:calmodulin-lysine N-methyltransferase [Anopheles aquasalis]XP_050084987.1 calmodulin-lysine N-methyltransferase [Anopheles aquasalis]
MRSTPATTTTSTRTDGQEEAERARVGGQDGDDDGSSRREDDINWKMSTQQQVTPAGWATERSAAVMVTEAPANDVDEEQQTGHHPSAVVVDEQNNPIKSLRRQRHCDITTTKNKIEMAPASTPPLHAADTERHRLRRTAAIVPDDEDDGGDGDEGVLTTTSEPQTDDCDVSRGTVVDDSNGGNREPQAPHRDTSNNNGHLLVVDRKPDKTVNARRRWKLLAKALRHDSSEDDQFSKFNLIEADRAGDEKDDNVYVYRLYDRYRLKIRLIGPERPWTATELIGFNNTGNICVWPSEEALAYYILSHLPLFDGTKVLELGGGMTCLAGLVLAKYGQPAFVHVTDGNELSVENVRKSLVLNKFNCTIKSSVLKWDGRTVRELTGGERYQFILSADCLFFDESRSQLIDTVWLLLAEEGVALITAPRRGNTLSLFLNECVARGFHYELLQCYNEAIWARHLELKLMDGYDENTHYPLLVKMYKYAHGSVLHRV